MKNFAPCFLLTLVALTGCGAAAGEYDADRFAADDLASDDVTAESDFVNDGSELDESAADAELGTSEQALISGGVSGGLGAKKPWCAARKTCYDKCDKDYPSGGGPLSTCKQLCDKTTESKCRPGAIGGGGIVIF